MVASGTELAKVFLRILGRTIIDVRGGDSDGAYTSVEVIVGFAGSALLISGLGVSVTVGVLLGVLLAGGIVVFQKVPIIAFNAKSIRGVNRAVQNLNLRERLTSLISPQVELVQTGSALKGVGNCGAVGWDDRLTGSGQCRTISSVLDTDQVLIDLLSVALVDHLVEVVVLIQNESVLTLLTGKVGQLFAIGDSWILVAGKVVRGECEPGSANCASCRVHVIETVWNR